MNVKALVDPLASKKRYKIKFVDVREKKDHIQYIIYIED